MVPDEIGKGLQHDQAQPDENRFGRIGLAVGHSAGRGEPGLLEDVVRVDTPRQAGGQAQLHRPQETLAVAVEEGGQRRGVPPAEALDRGP